MSVLPDHHGASPPAHSADDRAANSDTVPARVGIRFPAVRHWKAAIGGAGVLATILCLTLLPRATDLHAVQNGRRFSMNERRHAELALRAAGVTPSRESDGQLLVSAKELAAANAALEQNSGNAAGEASERPTTRSWLDHFSSSRRQRESVDAEKASQLGRLLEQLSGVESAEVVWDEEPRVTRRQAPRVRATVFLKAEPGCAIGLETVQAVRAAVSGSRAHLAAGDVSVMDLERRVTYGAETDASTVAAEVRRAELTNVCRLRIAAALADLDGVRFEVELHPASSIPADGSVATDAELMLPVAPVTRSRIAGVSGPNLRLDVAREAERTPESTINRSMPSYAPAGRDVPQLVVDVMLPAEFALSPALDRRSIRHRSPNSDDVKAQRQTSEMQIRQRVANAIAGLPVSVNAGRLNIRWEQSAETPATEVAVAGVETGIGIDWVRCGRFATALVIQHPAAVAVFVVVMCVIFWSRIVRRRSNSTRDRNAGYSSSPRRLREARGPIEFLPQLDASNWAPLIASEPTPVVAGLLRLLAPEDVAHVMRHLSPVQQRDVLELVPTSALDGKAIAALRRRVCDALRTSVSDPAPAVVRGKATFEGLDRVFDDLTGADDQSLRDLASRVPVETWSAALMGASPKLQRRLSRLKLPLSKSRDGGDRRPIRLREIESAQRLIVEEWEVLDSQR